MTAGQLAQAAYEAAVSPRMSAADSQAAATMAADAYRADQETRS
jgi:hypothetical protein